MFVFAKKIKKKKKLCVNSKMEKKTTYDDMVCHWKTQTEKEKKNDKTTTIFWFARFADDIFAFFLLIIVVENP